MEVSEYQQKYKSRRDEFTIYPLGDIHAGVKHCAENEIKRKVQAIAEDKFALWIGIGDYADFITPHDPRWDGAGIASWVEQSNVAESQRKWLVKLFTPIKDKCLGLLMGNHEDSIRLHNCQDVHLDLCRDLGVTNLGYSCFLRLVFHRSQKLTSNASTFMIHAEHGSGSAATEGGYAMRLKRALNDFQADLYLIGHMHQIKTLTSPYLYLTEGNKIQARNRVAAITGSWFRTYSQGVPPSYAEKRGYPPSNIGCPSFRIIPSKGFVEVIG